MITLKPLKSRKPHIRIKEWKGKWLLIKEPEDTEIFRTSEEATAKYVKKLHERIFELEANQQKYD